MGIVRGGNYLGGNCPGDTRPGGSCLGGNCPGGTCPGGSCPVTMYLYCIVIMFMPLIIKILKLTLCFLPILALFWSSLLFDSVRTM